MDEKEQDLAVQLLDLIEKTCITHIMVYFAAAGKKINEQEASNILAKVGVRLAFRKDLGKEAVDSIVTKTK